MKLGLVGNRDREVAAAIGRLEAAPAELGPDVPEAANLAKRVARGLHGRIPVIYAAQRQLEPVALRWRQQLNENANTLAHHGALPEQNHNEVVGWECPAGPLAATAVVALRDRGEHPRVRARFEHVLPLAEAAGARVAAVESRGERLLERLFSLVVTGDWVSLYLSFLNGVDPTPVTKIDGLKSRLEQIRAT
ncbi:MAG: hypothetical protein HZB25_08345 [Candidatus Eisenbacteria bacterium]|nr:hypothetical protein [Candidatus Eisenbacteria bacterium]